MMSIQEECNQNLLFPYIQLLGQTTYAVPKRMYKKDGSVGQSEKFPGLNAKKLSLMKGDKVVKLLEKSANLLLLSVSGDHNVLC